MGTPTRAPGPIDDRHKTEGTPPDFGPEKPESTRLSDSQIHHRPAIGFQDHLVLIVTFLMASTSGLTIILHALGWIALTYTVTFLAPLSAILIVALLIQCKRGQERVFVNRLLGGLVAGAIGLIAYDLVRLIILASNIVPFNPFRPIEVYGLLILNRYQDSSLTKLVGWGFHIWNGLSFALMYTLAFGRGRILWGLGWAMMLEAAMLASYPSLFRIALDWPFVSVSFVGHAAYGLAIGVTAWRVVQW